MSASTRPEILLWSNRAIDRAKNEEYKEAADLYRKALELSEKVCQSDKHDGQALVANANFHIGQFLRKDSKSPQIAEEYLLKALAAQEQLYTERGIVPVKHAINEVKLTREELGKVYEILGQGQKARDIRTPSQRICSNDKCPSVTYTSLSVCSRCESAWYCSKTCLEADLSSRHRAYCETLSPA